MKFSDLKPGKYKAMIADWGIETVAQLGGKPKAVITFDVQTVDPANNNGPCAVTGRWEGFFENKDGKPNIKTAKNLVSCGFGSDDPYDLNKTDSLNNRAEYEITVEKDGEYNRIEWINLPGQGGSIKKATTGVKVSSAFKTALADARKDLGITKPKPKNYAPGSGTSVNDDTEIPF